MGCQLLSYDNNEFLYFYFISLLFQESHLQYIVAYFFRRWPTAVAAVQLVNGAVLTVARVTYTPKGGAEGAETQPSR